jgi:hypothetical protein
MSNLDDTVWQPAVIVLAIFGNTNKVSEQELQENILIPILKELGRPPDKVLIPTEGNSSIYIQDWADALHIRSQAFHSDWIKNGRIAQIIRDDRMAKECTHALVFLSQKSTRLATMAEKICKKGKMVITSSHHENNQIHLESLCLEASEPSRKLDKGIAQMWQKYQKKAEC